MNDLSKRHEKNIAEAVGGKAVPASGAFWHSKGDVRSDAFLIEGKATMHASFSVKKAIWEKIRREALLTGRIPVLMLRIQDRDLVVLDLEDFLAIAFKGDMGEGGMP